MKTEKITLYDRDRDCFVVRTVAKVKLSVLPSDLDPRDRVRSPILQVLRDQEHDRDPRSGTYCVMGDREGCKLYDQLVNVSEDFVRDVPKRDWAKYINAPERVFLNSYPVFCEACIWVEHARRRREHALVRRFIRWVRPSR